MSDLSGSEIDEFEQKKEKVLLDAAGEYYHGADGSSDELSDEEVMALKHQNASDLEQSEQEDEEEDEDEADEGWGSKKNYYGGDDVSDDEAGREMADEALRQQKKHLQELHMDDFVDEDMMDAWAKTAELHDQTAAAAAGVVVEEDQVDLALLDDEEKLKFLQGSFPEFVPLLQEVTLLEPKLAELRLLAHSPVVAAKTTALTAYLGAISSYFAIFAENIRTHDRFSMKENPVMEAILQAREVWRQASELSLSAVEKAAPVEHTVEVSGSESEEELQTMQTDSESESEEEEEAPAPRREINIDVTQKRAIKKVAAPAVGDYTETAAPDSVDKEEKERRKKSLRFYTSKIDQAAQKNARNDKYNGDLDLPYKERLFERQQRLMEEARKRGLGLDKAQLGDSLDTADMDAADVELAHEINDNAAEYYEHVKQAKTAKKDARRAAHDEAKRAAREGTLAQLQEHVDADGKRALNFQILKNKGLTPNRRNENRNARVKKRKKYEQAKKKLKSVRQVYDQNTRGPYEGEKTGIKKGVSRSVKLV